MRTVVLSLLVLCGLLVSCSENEQSKPAYLLDEDKMVSVMVDMHLVETAQNLKLLSADSVTSRYNELFESIYLTHEVTKTEFDSSLFYYSTQTEQMNSIYDLVLERLYQMESEVQAKQ